MQKLFLAVCFGVAVFFQTVQAKVTEMNELGDAQPPASKPIDTSLPKGMPDPNDLEAVQNFFRERFQRAPVSTMDDLGDLNKPDSVNVMHSAEYIEQMQQENKSTFEKIYDQAMTRLSGNDPQEAASETVFYREATRDEVINEVDEMSLPDIPVVNVTLPSGKKIIAPAREHIPYLLASYNLLPTGLVDVQEDITVVANGQKLKNGFIKVLDKFSTSRAGVRKKLDMQLLSVTLDGQPVAHRLEEIGDKIYIKPVKSYTLPAGVHTYSLHYILDRKLLYYSDFTEFYADVSGSYLNLVITSANAVVSVPDGRTFMSQNILVGRRGQLSANRAVIASLDGNALGFASTTPLLPGEGMHLLVALDNTVFLAPDWNRRLLWFITDDGDVLFALGGLLAIALSYWLSWQYLRRRKGSAGNSFQKTAVEARRLLIGKTDQRALVAGILELDRKGILELRQADGALVLIKKTDRLSTLTRSEKNAVRALFPNGNTMIKVSVLENLKFQRALKAFDRGTRLSSHFSGLNSNLGYLLFSIAMLLCAETGIALLALNPLQSGMILLSGTLTMAFYIWMFRRRFKDKIVTIAVRTAATLFILGAMLFLSIYVKLITSMLILGMLCVIFEFDSLFKKRNDLLRSRTDEVLKLQTYLKDNIAVISKTQLFAGKQPYIFALGLTALYTMNEYNTPFYKLDLAERMLTEL